MPSTEIQRIVLLVLLGVVGYLLVYNWTQDYGNTPTPPAEPLSSPFFNFRLRPSTVARLAKNRVRPRQQHAATGLSPAGRAHLGRFGASTTCYAINGRGEEPTDQSTSSRRRLASSKQSEPSANLSQ